MKCTHCHRGFIRIHGARLACLFCNDRWRLHSNSYVRALSELVRMRKQKLATGYELEPLNLNRSSID